MVEILNYLKARYLSEKAQGIVEYALILAFVVVIAAGIANSGSIANGVKNVFNNVANLFTTPATKPGA